MSDTDAKGLELLWKMLALVKNQNAQIAEMNDTIETLVKRIAAQNEIINRMREQDAA